MNKLIKSGIIFLMFIALLVLGADGDPSKFGNSTTTTVWIGGSGGIGNFTGWIRSGYQINGSLMYANGSLVYNSSTVVVLVQGRVLNDTLSNYMLNSTVYAETNTRVLNTTLSGYMQNATTYGAISGRLLNGTVGAGNVTAGTFGTGSFIFDTNLTAQYYLNEANSSGVLYGNSTCSWVIKGQTSTICVV